MVTVIIPTLNEAENIVSVIRFAQADTLVSEVIVVDDKSTDNTVSLAKNAGAKVITSTKLGKGASMKDGVLCAQNNIVLFLDGDIDPYPHFTIPLLVQPIVDYEVDFVKSSFNRNAGRVTELVAKPLLSIFFPELMRFSQPLSGMIAGKKALFEQIDFRDDYGVDIGILIDMHLMHVRMKEVEIGYIENKIKPWHALGKMSKEVAQTIILKAARSKNAHYNLEELSVMNEIRSQMEFALTECLPETKKLILFDMDNILLKGRFIDAFSEKYALKKEIMDIRSTETDPVAITKRITTLLKGKSFGELIQIADDIPIVEDAAEVIDELKRRGYLIGFVSYSYDCITNHFKNKLGMHFSLGNELEFSKSLCTGEVKIPSFWYSRKNSLCRHAVCKTNAMLAILDKHKIKRENTIAVGNSLNDMCMIKEAGMGIAFCSKDELVNHHADIMISEPGFAEILKVAK